MNATIQLEETEIKQAIYEYITRSGVKIVSGDAVKLNYHRGCADPRGSEPDTISASVTVAVGGLSA